MKKSAPVIAALFHPLVMPTLGLLLLLNSGTYISLLDPAAKRAILFVMALGTLIFPLIMVPILYYRNLVSSMEAVTREERLVPQVIILILYIITFVYFVRLPLSRVIHGYVLSVAITLFVLIVLNLKFRISFHTAALGGITGLIIALIFLYETPLLPFLLIAIVAGGLTATAQLALGVQRSGEVYVGYLLGFGLVLGTLLIY